MNDIKKIRRLEVEADSIIELVELNGQKLVLKTAQSREEIELDKKFVAILSENKLPHINIFDYIGLLPNQLLMEYIKNSPTLADNKTAEWFKKWGETTRKVHQIKSNNSIKILPNGTEIKLPWKQFINEMLEYNLQKHRNEKVLDQPVINRVAEIINRWLQLPEAQEFSLIHGDLHKNNAIIKNGDVALFDKGSYMLYGNPYYDLSVPIFDYYRTAKHKELAEAFIEGYGKDEVKRNWKEIEMWIILRCFERFPSKFEPYTGKILQELLESYKI